MLLDFHVKTGTRVSLRDKRLLEKSEVETTRVDCMCKRASLAVKILGQYLWPQVNGMSLLSLSES